MSTHLRHCPKHRKPLPCPHCALIAAPVPELRPASTAEPAEITAPAPRPVTVEPAVPVLLCDYHRVSDETPWICTYCRHRATEDDIIAEGIPAKRVCSAQNIDRANKEALKKEMDKESTERERRAKAARERRKKQADELAAIRERLRRPRVVCIVEAKEETPERGIHDRTGGEKEISGGDCLGKTLLHLQGEDKDLFGVRGGKRVVPEGVGQRLGMREDNPHEDGTFDSDSCPDPWSSRAEATAVARPRTPIIKGETFSVKLNDKDERNSPAYECLKFYFDVYLALHYRVCCTKCGAVQDDDEQTVAEENYTCWRCHAEHAVDDDRLFVCKLCGVAIDGERGAACHMMAVHGDETSPNHDPRFGNVLRRWLRGGRKPPNLDKARRRAKKTVTG